jgi:hypothetical protein
MDIKFLNHSCFSIESNNTVLLNDPYLYGTAFNDGWDLIINDTNFSFDIKKNNFIYYSHEHPDHFSIPFLKSINAKSRNKITILYQKTKDGRVKQFLEKQGFNVKEIEDQYRYEFAKDCFITIGQVPFYDSWALFEVENKKILNVNDCILESPDRVYNIRKIIKNVDILFTQYSYANWVEGGDKNNVERKKLAKEKLNRIKIQSEVLSPKFIVPFASMVRFCHEENSYMNDALNTPRTTVDFINNTTTSKPFLMVPYEKWDGETFKNNEEAVKFWDNAYKIALKRDLIKQRKSYTLDEIQNVCNQMIKRVKKKNNIFLIKILSFFSLIPEQTIRITDINSVIKFSWHKGLEVVENETKFVEMTSESIFFLFAFDFGIDTLNVNARFNGNLYQKKNLIRLFSPLVLNNTGRYISLVGMLSLLLDLQFMKQGLKTVGLSQK